MLKEQRKKILGATYLAAAFGVAVVGIVVWNLTNFSWLTTTDEPKRVVAPVTSAPASPPTRVDKNVSFTQMRKWIALDEWTASNLQVQNSEESRPKVDTGAIRLLEDTQDSWRNVQTGIASTPNSVVKVEFDVKSFGTDRQAVVMLFSGPNRISCNLNLKSGQAFEAHLGQASESVCTANRYEGKDWWHFEMVGTVPALVSSEPTFLAITITKDGFKEDYKGDGESGLLIGDITLSQADRK